MGFFLCNLLRIGRNYYVEDSNARRVEAADPSRPDIRSYNLLFFNRQSDYDNYRDFPACGPFEVQKGAETFLNQQCTNRIYRPYDFGVYSDTNTLLMVAECTWPDIACNMTYVVVQQCWVTNTDNTAIPGLVLCVLAIGSIAALFIWRRVQKEPIEFDVGIVLVLLTAMTLLCVLFWALVIVDNGLTQQSLELSNQIQTVIFFTDKIILALSNIVLLVLLFQLATAVHVTRSPLVKKACLAFGIAYIVFFVATMVPYMSLVTFAPSNGWVHYFFRVFFGGSLFVGLLLAVTLLVYGIKLVHKSSDGTGESAAAVRRMVVLLAVLVAVFLARVVVATVLILQYQFEDNDLSWVVFNVAAVKFRDQSMGSLYYVFVVIIPDAVPCFAIVFLLFLSSESRRKAKASASAVAVPLLERYGSDDANIPVRYSI